MMRFLKLEPEFHSSQFFDWVIQYRAPRLETRLNLNFSSSYANEHNKQNRNDREANLREMIAMFEHNGVISKRRKD